MKRKKKIKISLFAGLLCIILAVLYLYFPNINESKPFKVIYISKVLDFQNDFWTQLIEGLNMAADEYHVDLSVVGPSSESDFEKQNELIEWALEQKPDIILLAPCRYRDSCKMAEKIKKQGIPLVLVDSNLEKNIADVYVSTDNIEAGNKLGTYLYEYTSEQSRIGVIAHEQYSSTAMERIEGLQKGLKDKSNLISEIAYSGSSYSAAEEATKRLLKRHPEVYIIAATNEYTTTGAGRAIRALGLQNEVSLVGFDSSIKEVQLLEENILKATVIQQSFKMGYYSIETAVGILSGKQQKSYINSGSMLITNENMYKEDVQKILFPVQ